MRGMILAVLSAVLLSGCATKGFVTDRVDDRAAEVEAEVDARITALQRALDESETTIQRQAAQLREVDETANNAFALATSAGVAAGAAPPARRSRSILSARGTTPSPFPVSGVVHISTPTD